MSAERLATWLLLVLGVYAAIGLLFAFAFAARGAARVDPEARAATWGFRLIVLPGATALWPLLAWRWWSGATVPPIESNAHRRAAHARETRS